ncbi:unnamed protein product [Candida verbasci]|uniref:Uncharacterized protein n=1 Tax=Candida verbasci TaxID=1227364 RepID=A0A9W4TQZ0_9ASCO|nr:unnamed protein product [Candida verbasci]
MSTNNILEFQDYLIYSNTFDCKMSMVSTTGEKLKPSPTITTDSLPKRSPGRLFERWKLPSQKMKEQKEKQQQQQQQHQINSSPLSIGSDSSFDDEEIDLNSTHSKDSVFSNKQKRTNRFEINLDLDNLEDEELEKLFDGIDDSTVCEIDEVVKIIAMHSSMNIQEQKKKLRLCQ